MEARICRFVLLTTLFASFGAGYKTPNFIVDAPTSAMAERIGTAAEKYRKQLAIEWLGQPLPDWAQACPIKAEVASHLGAGGETSFLFDRGEVYGWKMRVQGSETRVLDSVLPHEVTHTIFATHFRRPLPRWADEGACTTVEHTSEKTKQQNLLISFLRTNRGIAFSQMFAMREYPADVLPLYAQGYSLARFLIDQGGKRKFVNYVGEGMKRDQWASTTKKFYGFASLSALQESWLAWVKQGSPLLPQPNSLDDETTVAANERRERPEANLIVRAQNADSDGNNRLAANRSVASRVRPVADAANSEDNRDVDGVATGSSAFDRANRFDERGSMARADRDNRANNVNASAERGSPAIGRTLALNDRPSSASANRDGGSVYERGIEPSGNASQWPVTTNRPTTNRPTTNRPTAETDGRRVLLEWSRE